MAANRIDQLIDAWSPRLQQAFLQAVQAIRDEAQIGLLVSRLERGDVDGAIKAAGLDPERFHALDKALTDAFNAGGVYGAARIPALRDSEGFRLNVIFNVRNPRAEAWISQRSALLVTEIIQSQRELIRETARAGLAAGQNPRDTAIDLVGRIDPRTKRRVGGAIGLTSSQEEWVRNYRDDLHNLRSSAIQRELRDKRFDRTVSAAIRNGKPIPEDRIDAMVRNYRNNALRYRGEAIARTETMRALHTAQEEAFRQGLEKSGYTDQDVIRVWRSASDKRVRDTHKALNGQEVRGLEAPFVSPSGARLRYPGDPSAPAAETINCRCTVEMRIDFLRGVK